MKPLPLRRLRGASPAGTVRPDRHPTSPLHPEGTVLHTPIGRLRIIGFVEGISYLLLLFVAMPLKYLAGLPAAVSAVGMAHGVLFVLFVAALGHAALAAGWGMRRVAWAFASAVVPFGTFYLDARLREEQAQNWGPTVA